MSCKIQEAEDRGQRLCRDFAAQPSIRIMARTPRLSACGFSLFELVVVISIVAVLMAIFLERVLYYQEQAEKTAMVGVAGTIQSALTMQYGQILMRGKASDVEWLVKDNPMNWLQQKPLNYAGEFHDLTPLTVESGNWVFDLDSRNLIYIPRVADNFKPGKDGRQWIRYHVVVNYESPHLLSLQDAPRELTGILFEPVEPYSWF
ncbi:MAG: hypothetical protein A3J24_07790 [Deltaproteobacteria bacterium RIFCSPLOWO2_02_FULL_53_8]|nr:MAG: hypothetical protein A3J24_07790 [Deltaproteobacteria bacterium RIFCSPLOWO2_02_FULL_53_8]